MKAVMFLSILIGILLSLLIFLGARYIGPGRITNAHVKVVERNSDGIIKTICHEHVEYIMVNGNGSAIMIATGQSGKPLQCNY